MGGWVFFIRRRVVNFSSANPKVETDPFYTGAHFSRAFAGRLFPRQDKASDLEISLFAASKEEYQNMCGCLLKKNKKFSIQESRRNRIALAMAISAFAMAPLAIFGTSIAVTASAFAAAIALLAGVFLKVDGNMRKIEEEARHLIASFLPSRTQEAEK